MRILGITVIVACLALSGCSGVKFYSETSTGQKREGLKFYTAKPYLLFVKLNDLTVAYDVIYLPDLAEPQYAKITPGFGSAKHTFQLENSILKTYNQETDQAFAENLGAIGGFLKMLAEQKAEALVKSGKDFTFELYEIVPGRNGAPTSLVNITPQSKPQEALAPARNQP